MAFDESAHIFFVGCSTRRQEQNSGRFQSEKGADDLMFYPASKRIYTTSGGTGMVNVDKETDPDHYQSLGQIPSGPGGKTGLLVPQLSRLIVPVPPRGTTPSAVYVYELQ